VTKIIIIISIYLWSPGEYFCLARLFFSSWPMPTITCTCGSYTTYRSSASPSESKRRWC